MTDVEFSRAVRSLDRNLHAAATLTAQQLRDRWMRALKRGATPGMRKKAREEVGAIFVGEYTVKAHWRRLTSRRQ